MYRERMVKCKDCSDVFKIVYDSKKEQQDKYKCKCGKLICSPNRYGSFSYEKNGNYQELSYEEEQRKLEYYEDDYIRLTDEELELFYQIENISKCDEFTYDYTSYFDQDSIRLELSGYSKQN